MVVWVITFSGYHIVLATRPPSKLLHVAWGRATSLIMRRRAVGLLHRRQNTRTVFEPHKHRKVCVTPDACMGCSGRYVLPVDITATSGGVPEGVDGLLPMSGTGNTWMLESGI